MPYIEIVGVMGSGKTSLLKLFNERMDYVAISETPEQLENLLFLEPYLKDPKTYGFEGCVNFIALHLNRVQEAIYELPEGRLTSQSKIVTDNSFVMQYAYAKGCLSPEDLAIIEPLVRRSVEKVPQPDLRIVVQLPVDVNMQRLHQRNWPGDRTIPRDFVSNTREVLDEALWRVGGDVPTLYLNSSKYDWVSNERDKQKILQMAQEKMNEKAQHRPKAASAPGFKQPSM